MIMKNNSYRFRSFSESAAKSILLLVLIASLSLSVSVTTSSKHQASLLTQTSQITNRSWMYKGHRIRYQAEKSVSNDGPAVLMVHGFGGNADQFRKNLPALQSSSDVYSIDLLGYGYSAKPDPRSYEVNGLYNFETWGAQLSSFIEEVIGRPTVIVSNSVGGVAALQTAVTDPQLVRGVVLINLSMRMLHIKKQNFLRRPIVSAVQTFLRETDIGKTFFKQVATPATLKNILNQAYGYAGTSNSVDDETVNVILQPGLEPGAAEVFLDVISNSEGPLAEELLPHVRCPVRFLWGENDPWEPMEQAKELYFGDTIGKNRFECVDEFVELRGGGHCPMDQIPDKVNEEILRFLKDYHNPGPQLKLSSPLKRLSTRSYV